MAFEIKKGTTNISRKVMIVDSSTGAPETGITITDLDMQYTRELSTPASKVDAIVSDDDLTTHVDNKIKEVDATSSPGLYMVCWPDAAFATGAGDVQLMVTGTGFAPVIEEINLVDNLAGDAVVGGVALSTPAKDEPDGFTIVWGENEANDEDSTHAKDGTTHDIEAQNDTTEKIDVYYEFSIGGDGLPTGIVAHHQLDKGGGAAKNITIFAYNWGTASWDQIGILNSNTVLATDSLVLFTSHVGTGTDLGKVRIRYNTGTVAFSTTTKLLVDQIFVEYAVVSRTIGYAGGAIWYDDGADNVNTEDFVDGVADNPVSTWAAALALNTSLGLNRFMVANGSSVTLSDSSADYTLMGKNWTLVLAGQTVDGISINGASVSGVMGGSGTSQAFNNCHMGNTSLIANTHLIECGLEATLTIIEAGDYFFDRCHSGIAGTSTPTLDFGGAIGSTNLNMRNYSGGIQLENMGDAGTDTASIEGRGQIIEGTCTSGVVAVRGNFTLSGITNLTLSDDARFAIDQLNTNLLLKGTSTGSSTTTKVFVQSGDPPSGGADDDYNNAILVVYRGTDKSTARVNMRTVTDYDDSDPSFTVDTAFGFTPQANDVVEVYLTDPEVASSMSKLSSGFGTSSPDRLIDHHRAMMSKAATAPSSGVGSYDPTTDSLEVLGEGQVAMKGAAFNTGTDSLQAIRDAIDTLIAPSIVGSSALSGSGFLSDCVSLIRKAVDEPSTTPKYTDSDLVELIQGAFDVVIQDISINTDHPILVRLSISVVDGKQTFTLPPHCAGVWRVAKVLTSTNTPIWEIWPKGQFSFHGGGFTLEGNTLRLNMDWNSSETLEILYEPNGETAIHKATAAAIDSSTVTFPDSVTDGTLDTREQCYAGYMIRILSSDQNIIEERIISSYDNDTQIATVSEDFTETHTGTVVYEVLPQYTRLLKHVICLQASLDLLAGEGNAQKIKTLERSYKVKMSALRREVSRKQARFPGFLDSDTSDNEDRGGFYGGVF